MGRKKHQRAASHVASDTSRQDDPLVRMTEVPLKAKTASLPHKVDASAYSFQSVQSNVTMVTPSTKRPKPTLTHNTAQPQKNLHGRCNSSQSTSKFRPCFLTLTYMLFIGTLAITLFTLLTVVVGNHGIFDISALWYTHYGAGLVWMNEILYQLLLVLKTPILGSPWADHLPTNFVSLLAVFTMFCVLLNRGQYDFKITNPQPRQYDLKVMVIRDLKIQKDLEAQLTQLHGLVAQQQSQIKVLSEMKTTQALQVAKYSRELLTANKKIEGLQSRLQVVDQQADTLYAALNREVELRKKFESAATQLMRKEGELSRSKALTVQQSFRPIEYSLVLVDADSYHWSSVHLRQRNTAAGASAAHAIKIAVQEYFQDMKADGPPHGQIVARVLCNMQGRARAVRKLKGANNQKAFASEDFAIAFTESAPLFDYVDAGQGKERADSKIQALYHLSVNNPQCRKIFLAAATDNSFARLLEQYAADQIARAKTVLVHPGYVAREIAALDFEAIQWPNVFQQSSMYPLDLKRDIAICAQTLEYETARELAASRLLTYGLLGSAGVNLRPELGTTMRYEWHGKQSREAGVRNEGIAEEVD